MKTHISLSPIFNILLILLWVLSAVFCLFVLHVPLTVILVGCVFGALAGLMQHMSIAQDAGGFAAASSLIGVRRALKGTLWGSRYILWLYFCKIALIVIVYALIRRPLFYILFGYLGGYSALMLARELVTLRDTILLHGLKVGPRVD